MRRFFALVKSWGCESLIVTGTTLAAYGVTGFSADLSGSDGALGISGSAYWDNASRFQVAFGAMLAVSGVLLRNRKGQR